MKNNLFYDFLDRILCVGREYGGRVSWWSAVRPLLLHEDDTKRKIAGQSRIYRFNTLTSASAPIGARKTN